MRARPMFHPRQSDVAERKASRSPVWSTSACSNTLSSMGFTRRALRAGVATIHSRTRRQAECMAKARVKAPARAPKKIRLPKQIERAIAAAEDKKAEDLLVLDLRKA